MNRNAGILVVTGLAVAMAACGREPQRHDFKPDAPTAGGLEQVAEFDSPLANVAVSPEGRVFVTFHPLGSPEVKVAEVTRDGRAAPYPDRAWQTRDDGFQTPQGIKLDTRGRLWVLDYGKNGLGTPALIAFDVGTGKLVHRHDFTGEEAGLGSYLNDLSIDADAGKIYIADTANYNFNPALIVYDIASGKVRRVLEDHKSVKEEPIDMVVEGGKVKVFGLMPLRVAVDSIVLDLDSKYLYYGPMSGTRLYRVPVAALLDPSLSGKDLEAKVEDFAPKPVSDGITIDRDGNVYLTAIEQRGVVVIHPNGKGETLLRDDRLVWPDGFSFGPAGWIYVADSHLNRILFKSKKKIARDAPFVLYRFKGLAPGLPGR